VVSRAGIEVFKSEVVIGISARDQKPEILKRVSGSVMSKAWSLAVGSVGLEGRRADPAKRRRPKPCARGPGLRDIDLVSHAIAIESALGDRGAR
jgi:hypothetical protein